MNADIVICESIYQVIRIIKGVLIMAYITNIIFLFIFIAYFIIRIPRIIQQNHKLIRIRMQLKYQTNH